MCDAAKGQGARTSLGGRARLFLEANVFHHEAVKEGGEEAAETEEHAKVSPNVGGEGVSVVDVVLLFHLIIS